MAIVQLSLAGSDLTGSKNATVLHHKIRLFADCYGEEGLMQVQQHSLLQLFCEMGSKKSGPGQNLVLLTNKHVRFAVKTLKNTLFLITR